MITTIYSIDLLALSTLPKLYIISLDPFPNSNLKEFIDENIDPQVTYPKPYISW